MKVLKIGKGTYDDVHDPLVASQLGNEEIISSETRLSSRLGGPMPGTRYTRVRAGPVRCMVIHVRRENDRYRKNVVNEACEIASEVQNVRLGWRLLRLILRRNGMGAP